MIRHLTLTAFASAAISHKILVAF